MVAVAMAVLAVGALVGWLIVGGALIADLQVEPRGSMSYGDYQGMRQISRAVGVVAGVLPVALLGAGLRSMRRRRRQRAAL